MSTFEEAQVKWQHALEISRERDEVNIARFFFEEGKYTNERRGAVMNNRDELAQLIHDAIAAWIVRNPGKQASGDLAAADAILAAGWTAPVAAPNLDPEATVQKPITGMIYEDCARCVGEEVQRRNASGARWIDTISIGFIVCSECGNKRCPKASDHSYECGHSNEPGQVAVLAARYPNTTESNQP